MPTPITIDQLEVFAVVARAQGFAEAARTLGRTQSAVSKAVANLERLLEVRLFERTARGVELTPAGLALLPKARRAVQSTDWFTAEARRIAQQPQADVYVAIDAFASPSMFSASLMQWHERWPEVPLVVRYEHLETPASLLLGRDVELAVCGPKTPELRGLECTYAGTTWMIPVCGARHPLAQCMLEQGSVSRSTLSEHLHLYLTERSRTRGDELTRGVREPRWWKLSDLTAKHALLREGAGWGMMPEHVVREDLNTGVLVQLRIDELRPRWAHEHYIAWRTDVPLSEEAEDLRKTLLKAAKTDDSAGPSDRS